MKTCPFCAEEIQDAAIVCKHCGRNLSAGTSTSPAVPVARQAARRTLFSNSRLLALAIGALVVWAMLSRAESRQRAIAIKLPQPITVTDEIENVPAASWKAVAVNLPYTGNLDVSLNVVRGNPLDVFLTTPDQLAMRHDDWGNVRVDPNFNAVKTKAFHRTGSLRRGSYYLVLRDTSLGILSSSASDVSLTVRLNP